MLYCKSGQNHNSGSQHIRWHNQTQRAGANGDETKSFYGIYSSSRIISFWFCDRLKQPIFRRAYSRHLVIATQS